MSQPLIWSISYLGDSLLLASKYLQLSSLCNLSIASHYDNYDIIFQLLAKCYTIFNFVAFGIVVYETNNTLPTV